MVELLQANWLLVVVALLIGIATAWWIFVASRRTKVQIETSDKDAGPAKRNQALIDAPPAAARELTGTEPASSKLPRTAASPGAVSAAANTQDVAAAPLGTDAEAGDGTPARAAMDAVPPHADGAGDDLTRIKGLGPKLADLLAANGVTSLAQIAAWDDAEIDRIDARLGRFQGRIRRDSWVEQAKLLQGGDKAAYEERFGRTS